MTWMTISIVALYGWGNKCKMELRLHYILQNEKKKKKAITADPMKIKLSQSAPLTSEYMTQEYPYILCVIVTQMIISRRSSAPFNIFILSSSWTWCDKGEKGLHTKSSSEGGSSSIHLAHQRFAVSATPLRWKTNGHEMTILAITQDNFRKRQQPLGKRMQGGCWVAHKYL